MPVAEGHDVEVRLVQLGLGRVELPPREVRPGRTVLPAPGLSQDELVGHVPEGEVLAQIAVCEPRHPAPPVDVGSDRVDQSAAHDHRAPVEVTVRVGRRRGRHVVSDSLPDPSGVLNQGVGIQFEDVCRPGRREDLAVRLEHPHEAVDPEQPERCREVGGRDEEPRVLHLAPDRG